MLTEKSELEVALGSEASSKPPANAKNKEQPLGKRARDSDPLQGKASSR